MGQRDEYNFYLKRQIPPWSCVEGPALNPLKVAEHLRNSFITQKQISRYLKYILIHIQLRSNSKTNVTN